MIFKDRRQAGRFLAKNLLKFRGKQPIVMALPRGGVPVAYEVAHALAAPLDLVLVRKISAPHQPEFAIGAIAEGPTPEPVIDPRLIQALEVSEDYLEAATARALAEIERRRAVYLGTRKRVELRGRVVIVVDDGIATGATMLAALRAVRKHGPARLVMAVPVAAEGPLEKFRTEADQIECLHVPEVLRAVGHFYHDFSQLEDQEVIDLLAANTMDIGHVRRR